MTQTMAYARDYVNIVQKGDDASRPIKVTVVETVGKPMPAVGIRPVDSKKKKKGCRELVESNASVPIATPSVQLHMAGCTCSAQSIQDLAQQKQEDEALVRRIQAASAVCLAKTITGTPPGSPRNASFSAFQSVTRWFSGAAADTTSVSELCFACAALDTTKAARLLFDEAVPVNGKNAAGTPPLIAAVRSHMRETRPRAHLAMLSFLIDAGADPNAVTTSSPASGTMSVLAAASALGLSSAVWLLLDRGAAVDARLTTIPMFRFTGHSLTPLHVAVFAGQTETAGVLLAHGGADVTATFDGHRSAATNPDGERSTSITSSSKQRDRRAWTTGITPLHLADDSAACTDLLLRHGADAGARDGWGRTPLHWAMATGNADVVRLLLRAGAAADAVDDDGATPLAALVARLESGASRQGHPLIVRMLLASGANPDLRYPQDLSVKARLLLMDEWRAVYEPLFEKYQLGGSPRLRYGRR